MWSRVELKNNAKMMLKKNYWWMVLIALILGFVSNETSSVSYSQLTDFSDSANESISENYDLYDYDYDEYEDYDYDYDYDEFDDYYGYEDYDKIDDLINGNMDKGIVGIIAGAAIIVLIVLAIVMVIAVILSVFLLAPIQIGCKRWFIKNRATKPEINEVIYVFSNGYMNTVKIMFFKQLYTFFWTMLFIVPGIVKGYEYRMIPYLLAENPNMDMKEAFARSKAMMDGNKWDTFVLDLSFLGWELLSTFTCGIVGIFYVNPYMHATYTELYVALCMNLGNNTGYSNSGKYVNFDDNQFNDNQYNSGDYSNQSGIDRNMF